MTTKLTSSIIVLLLLMNVLFEISLPHHCEHLNHSTETTTSTFDNLGDVDSHQDVDTCGSETCHFGFCKLLNLNTVNYNYPALNDIKYGSAVLDVPASPALTGNRRPPIHA